MSSEDTNTAASVKSLLVATLVSVLTLTLLVEPVAAAEPAEIVPDESRVLRGSSVEVDVLANDFLGEPAPEGPVSITVTSPPAVGSAVVLDPDQAGGVEAAAAEADPVPVDPEGGDPAPSDAAPGDPALSDPAGDDSALAPPVLDEAERPLIRYTPGADAPLGSVTFTYTVSVGDVDLGSAVVTAAVENAPPVANPDEATVTSAPGDVVGIAVLANDADPDSGVLTVSAVGDPDHGSTSLDRDLVTYAPVDDYVGPDRFAYTIVDDQGGSADGIVEVTVTDATSPMVLRDDRFRVVAGRTKKLKVLANDVGGGRGPLRVVAVGDSPGRAAITIQDDGRTVAYRARMAFVGSDHFTYRVRDRRGNRATATVVVKASSGVNIKVSGPLSRRSVPYSYRPGCPVRPKYLRRMHLSYWSFWGDVRRGTLIVRQDAVNDLKYVFTRAFNKRFRIKKIKPIDGYYNEGRRSPTGSDRAAMRAGNTSAFNCRTVVGNPTKRSAHSYGIAIDINTFQNPYVVGRTFYPPKAGAYLRRVPCRKGMICPGGVVATSMRSRGWPWGARWSNPDYQHFSATGG